MARRAACHGAGPRRRTAEHHRPSAALWPALRLRTPRPRPSVDRAVRPPPDDPHALGHRLPQRRRRRGDLPLPLHARRAEEEVVAQFDPAVPAVLVCVRRTVTLSAREMIRRRASQARPGRPCIAPALKPSHLRAASRRPAWPALRLGKAALLPAPAA